VTTLTAAEWRMFWQERGMRELGMLLPAGYEPYATRVATLLGSRASNAALAAELGRIRADELGLEPDPPADAATAQTIARWFEGAAAR
jgi:hypothetical protein